ncbi:MAG TPA: acyloxyacyl hydrolase [Burkholderiales bacterium]
MKRFLLIALLAAPCTAAALDGVSLEAGRGNGQTDLLRVGLQWRGHTKWFEGSSWRIAHYIDLTLGGWYNGEDTVYDLGLTPVFRFERSAGSPYFEAAIGFHAVSNLEFQRNRETSTRFQFGDHIGVGFLHGRYDIGLRLQHLSNGGIRDPNPGINFVLLRVRYELP